MLQLKWMLEVPQDSSAFLLQQTNAASPPGLAFSPNTCTTDRKVEGGREGGKNTSSALEGQADKPSGEVAVAWRGKGTAASYSSIAESTWAHKI